MMMPRLPRWVMVCFAALIVAGAALLWYTRGGLGAPLLNESASGTAIAASATGPLRLEFPQPVVRASVESRFTLEPAHEGRFVWLSDQEALFFPAAPLAVGQEYHAELAVGVEGAAGQRLRQRRQWQITAREARLFYLSPSRAPELWSILPDGSTPKQLTGSGGAVYDYTVSPDGSLVFFSARNEENGLDLWKISLPSGAAEILLPCGPDWCLSPAISPDGSRLAYSRRVFSGIAGSAPGAPRIWMLRVATNETDLLFVDPNISGVAAGWSPDGRYLAFVDELDQSVRVVDILKDVDFSISTGSSASFSWLPDSLSLLVTRSETTEAFPYSSVYRVDPESRQEILWVENEIADFSAPVFSADGRQAAVARREVNGAPGKQLWLVNRGGSLVRELTSDPLGNYASYQWDPNGRLLAFQRLQISGSESRPSVGIWDREANQFRTLAEDAFLPRWVP